MLPEIHDPILDLLIDALAELPEPGEQVYSSAEEWPSWTDLTVGIGRALIPDELLPDDPDQLPGDKLALTDAATIAELRSVEDFPRFEPAPEEEHWVPIRAIDAELEALLDQAERAAYERGCNARFV
jgi:hypothetical protein